MATADIIAGLVFIVFLATVFAVLIVAWKWRNHIRKIRKEYQKEVEEKNESKEEETPEEQELSNRTSRYEEVIERTRAAEKELRSLRDERDAGSVKRQRGLQIPSYKKPSEPNINPKRIKRKSKKSKHTIELHKPTDL